MSTQLSIADLHVVLEAIGEGVLLRDRHGELVWANSEALRLIGVSSVEELLAVPLDQLARRWEVFDLEGHPVDAAQFPGRRALSTGSTVEQVLRYREISTTEDRWVLIRAQDLRDPQGAPAGSVTVFRDVTTRQKALIARAESEDRMAFLASAGPQLLAASLDYRGVLERVADLVVPRMADYCAIREIDDEGTARRLAVRHADPAKSELVRRLETYPVASGEPLRDDLKEGRSVLMRDLTAEQVRAGARDAEHLALLEDLNPISLLAVPVRARGRTVGLIILIRAESGRHYDDADVVLMEDLARRAGLAIDNARLYEAERRARSDAEEARTEVAFLLEASTLLATSLDFETNLQRLGHLATANLCDLCLIDLVEDGEETVRRVVAAAHPDDQALAEVLREEYAPIPGSNHPALVAIRTGRPEYSGDLDAATLRAGVRDARQHDVVQSLGVRSYVTVPLTARDRVLGALTLMSTHKRSGRLYGEKDTVLASDLARRAGLALDNARLHQETEFQKALLTSQSEAALEGILVVSPDTRVVSYNHQFATMWGMPAELLDGGDANAALHWVQDAVLDPEAFLAGVHQLRANPQQRSRDEIRLRDGRVFDRWTAPLLGGDGTHHGRAWYFRDISEVKEIQAERVRLYDAERQARVEAETSHRRLGFLLEASTLLSSSLDMGETLTAVARLVTDTLADACLIQLVDDDGALQPGTGSLSPTAQAAPGEAGPQALAALDAAAGGVLQGRLPTLITDTTAAGSATAPDPAGLTSYMAAPLLARGRTLGALSAGLMAGATSGHFSIDDFVLMQDLARRVSLAVEHTRLYDTERHVAMTLQKSLLPPELPQIPGVAMASRYRAASAASEVGGDFYDLFATLGGAWAITIGDISGKGVEAASLTALARYTVRAAAREHAQPREILDRLNTAVLAEPPTGRFLTIALARLRWRANARMRMTVACGGHPLPLLLRDGVVTPAGRPGTLIGFHPSPDLPEKVTDLGPGDVVLFYTDGLTDVRGPDGVTFGEGRVIALLKDAWGQEAEQIAARLEAEVLAFQAGEQRDDLAILVLQVVGQPQAGPEPQE